MTRAQTDPAPCHVCGRPVPAGLLSCPTCGAPRRDAPAAPAPRASGLNPLAVGALVLALVGVPVATTTLPLPVLPSMLAIWLSRRARREIGRGGRGRGAGIALAAAWIGVVGIVTRVVVMDWTELQQPLLILLFIVPAVFGLLFWAAGKGWRGGQRPGRAASLPWDR